MIRWLRREPRIRNFVKYVALFVFYYGTPFLPNVRGSLASKIEVCEVDDFSTFFGYHDVPPDNGKGLVITHLADRGAQWLIAVLNEADFSVVKQIPLTKCNLQIGARAQWLSEHQIIFNDFDLRRKVMMTKIFDIATGEMSSEWEGFMFSVIDPNTIVALNHSAIALHDPDYAVSTVNKRGSELRILLSICDTLGNKELTIGSDDLGSPPGASCINHTRVSPESQSLIFIERKIETGVRADRLWKIDLRSHSLHPLTNWMVISHFCFVDEESILVYCGQTGGELRFRLMDLGSKDLTPVDLFGHGRDGHPFLKGDVLICDTYPSLFGYQSLYFGSYQRADFSPQLKLRHPAKFFGANRCDLHPRFSVNGKYVYFDSVFTGRRTLCRINIDDEF